MKKFRWKKSGLLAGFVLSLALAGRGQGDEDSAADNGAETTTSYSEEMNYTITGIEPGAGQSETNDIAIAEYDSLTGWDHELSSTGAMLSALDEAISNEKPIVVSAWSPHYMFANWDIKYLEDPKGIFGEAEAITTLARLGLKEEMPEAHTLLERISFEISDVEEALLEAQEKSFEAVAQEWVDNNQETIAEWTDGIESVEGTSINLGLTPWDAETFTSNVAKIVLEELGYSVSLTPVDPAILFKAIATGDTDATLAPWMPATHGELYAQYEGEFEDLGPNVEGARIGLAVPSYMDIDSIEDLEPKQ